MKMSFTVYILRSEEGKYYIGHTNNIERRLTEHRNGISTWSRKYKGWKLLRKEEYETRSEAMKREKYLKSFKGGNGLKSLIAGS